MRNVPDFLGDGSRGNEEVVRRLFAKSLLQHLSCPLQVNDRIDHHVGDVDSMWSRLTSYCFCEFASKYHTNKRPSRGYRGCLATNR